MKRASLVIAPAAYLFCVFLATVYATDTDPNFKKAEDFWNIAKKVIITSATQEHLFPKQMEISAKSVPDCLAVVYIPEFEVFLMQQYDGKKFVILPRTYSIEPKSQPVIKATIYLVDGGKRKEIGTFRSKAEAVVVNSDGSRKLIVR
ncbi:MAG TPA: hypothetical protein VMT62_16430 [Syntrophorhabdaceae bacterium]|nr:hypothetical protein [Syntrophorhabdaceae bacterium]